MNQRSAEPMLTDLIEHQASQVEPGTVLVIFQCQRCQWDTNWLRRDSNDLTPPPCPTCSTKGLDE